MKPKMKIPPELDGEYIIRVIDMPLCTKGCIIYDDDGFANIYLNAHYTRETNEDSADHEIFHLLEDDINNADDIRTVEARADARIAKPLRVPHLLKARDLLPPKPKPVYTPKKTEIRPYQRRVLFDAISALDRLIFEDIPED